jgi:RNA recognition motif-containing protein
MNAAMAGLSREEQITCLARLLNEDEEMVELNKRLRWPSAWQSLVPIEACEFEAEITVTIKPLPPVPEEEEIETDPEIEGNTNPTLRIGNLSTASDRKKLMASINAVFGKHGEIRDVNLPMDKATGNPRGFAFIEFRDPRDAMRAFKAENGTLKVGGRDIRVEMARSARKTTEEMAAQYGARPEKKKGADAATTDA